MNTYTFAKASLNLERLTAEIVALAIPDLLYTDRLGGDVRVHFSRELTSGEQDSIAAVVTAHVAVTTSEYVGGVIVSASDYGAKLIRDFGTRNLLLGKSDADIDSILENTEMLKIGLGLQSGSLKYARRKVQALEPFAGITADDKAWMLAQLELFLGPE